VRTERKRSPGEAGRSAAAHEAVAPPGGTAVIPPRWPIVLVSESMRKTGVDIRKSTGGVVAVYAGFFLVCILVAVTGGIANSYGLASWYPSLVKPSFNPPNWLFGPVWTVLYGMIAVAGARYVLSPAREKEPTLALYTAQLALNAAWSWVFFYGQAIGAAIAVVVALWFAIAATIGFGWNKDRLASLLLIPYLAWVSFATLLNVAIWRLNS
jgi:benzodiazapine receptor